MRYLFVFLLFTSFTLAALENKPAATIVLFGATGDLTAKKLIPALYQLEAKAALSDQLAIVGFARAKHTDDSFRQLMQKAIESNTEHVDPLIWERFQKKISYHASDFAARDGYLSLKKYLETRAETCGKADNRLYYLSVPPSFFPTILSQLQETGLISDPSLKTPWTRIIIEKPFGSDLKTAQELQNRISQILHETQIYRMDHYLGKIGLHNILALRFENRGLEPLWNHHSRAENNKQSPEAYEKLFYEALKGDQSLFVSFEELEIAWKLFTPVLEQWKASQDSIPIYPADTWGPVEAEALLENGHEGLWQQ